MWPALVEPMLCSVTRRAALLLCLVALVAALAPATARPAPHGTYLGSLHAGLLTELNAVRAAHGLAPLKMNGALGAAARRHSSEMVANAYFQHESPDGSPFWQRVERFYGQTGRGTWSVGENLLWAGGSIDAKKAVVLWMDSPGHRRNILTARWREVGIAAVHSESQAGPWGSGGVTIITADFGVRG
jgi:uncharacterized protein YkwD